MAFVSLLAAATFSSCNNDDGNGDDPTGATESITIAAEVENFDGVTFDSIVAVADGPVTVGRGAYSSGKLTLTLDATVGSANLQEVFKEIPAGLTVSNPNVKGTENMYVYVYKSGSIAGELSYGTAEWEGIIRYVDGDVGVSGSFTDEGITSTYSSLNLKKGWNIAYTKTSGMSVTITTTAPQGAKWSYEPSGGNSTGAIESNTIAAEVENFGSVAFDSIVAITDGFVTLGRGDYSNANGKLTVTLDATVGSSNLSRISDDTPPGVTVSNPNVKGVSVYVYVYSSGAIAGELSYGTAECESSITYVDDDVSLTGSFMATEAEIPFTLTYDVNLKKGWNIVYISTSGTSVTITTTAPQGAKWSYEPGSPNSVEYDELRVVVYSDDGDSEMVVGSATFDNGELTLPEAEVSSNYLSRLGDDMPDGVAVSDPDVKVALGGVHAYKSGYKTGEFLHGVADWIGLLMYVDGDVSITGSYMEEEEEIVNSFSLDLKKGWNIAYAHYSEEGIAMMTTTAPEGATWNLIGQDYEASATTSKSLKAQKALAKRCFIEQVYKASASESLKAQKALAKRRVVF